MSRETELEWPPAPQGRPRPGWDSGLPVATLALIALLYFGRDILLPFALAVLLAFILDPAVTRLRRWGLPRGASVLSVILATALVLGATSYFVGGQVIQLGKDLPTYQSTIQKKLRDLRQLTTRQGVVDDASRVIEAVGDEIEAARRDLDPSRPDRRRAPQRVVVEPAESGPLQSVKELLAPVLTPLATAGIVMLFVVFLLLEKKDLRDRLLRLAGGNLHRSTEAMSEAGSRVSRYLTMQWLVNLSYGVPMALGLWLIGVPGALLWGLLSALLRFVPYIGPAVAAAFPLLLALAVDPGWQMLAWTLALVVTLELLSNNLVEPWLYGASTGLSPVSVVVSAIFWTALWGPIGLVLATPLTVCFAVLGRHLPQLAWLDMLLGNQPAFDPATRLYQRLLANDVEEAVEMADEQIARSSPAAFYGDTGVPALRLAALDQDRPSRVEQRYRVATGMSALLRNLHGVHPAPLPGDATATVLCVGARREIDTLAAEMLGHALAFEGVPTRVLPASAVSADHIESLPLDGVRVLCLSSFGTAPEAQLRFLARRLERQRPGLRIVAALWNAPPALLTPEATAGLGVDAVAREFGEALQRLRAGLEDADDGVSAGRTADTVPPDEARRTRALHHSGALDPALRAPLDRAAQHAADVFAMPQAMVALVDARHRICQGLAGSPAAAIERVLPRDATLCDRVVALGTTLVVADTARDPRCAALPALQRAGVRFYAGAPLRTRDGQVIGVLSVQDQVPRQLAAGERRLLEKLADEVMTRVQAHAAAPSDAQRAAAAPADAPADRSSGGPPIPDATPA